MGAYRGKDRARLLLVRGLVAAACRRAAREVDVVLIRTRGAHGAQAPVSRGGIHPGKPGLGVLRRSAIWVLRAETLTGLRRTFGGVHADFLSEATACATHGDLG